MSKPYTPPYKFKHPKSPDNPYDIICPYWKSDRKNIQFDFEPIRFAPPRLKLQKQLKAPAPGS